MSRLCSINIGQMQALVTALQTASEELPSNKSRADSLLTDASLSLDATFGVSPIATWIADELRPTRRRLALAQEIAASSPGSGLVTFDESLVSTATPAQVKQRVRQATTLLKAGDPKSLQQLTKLLQDNGLDPYFASAFAKQTTPEDYEKYVKAIGPTGGYSDGGKWVDGKYPDGVTAEDYQQFVSLLGGTLGQATRATGSLALPPSWSKNFVQLMVNPFEGPDGHKYDEDPTRQADLWWGRSVLSLLMSRGSFSTPFLKTATKQISKVAGDNDWQVPRHYLPDGTPMPPIPVDQSRRFPVVGANGVLFGDPVVALMGALAQNGEAADWAFTQGGSTDYPLDGKQVPVNSFMSRLFTSHDWPRPQDMNVAMLAIGAAVQFNPTSTVSASIHNFIDSAKQQKAEWDAKPWYEKWGHQILDGLSLLALLIPVPGVDVAVSGGIQVLNGIWYAGEGDWADAGLSLAFGALGGLSAFRALRSGVEAAEAIGKIGADELPAALKSGIPNQVYECGELRYLTDADGAVTRLQIEVGGSWKDVDLSPSKVRSLLTRNGERPWHLQPLTRGDVIEEALAQSDYKDWVRVGSWDKGKFPVIDFAKGDEVVSLKTLDSTSEYAPTAIRKNIRGLRQAIRDGSITSRQGTSWTGIKRAELEIRYPKGKPPSSNLRNSISELAKKPPPVNVTYIPY